MRKSIGLVVLALAATLTVAGCSAGSGTADVTTPDESSAQDETAQDEPEEKAEEAPAPEVGTRENPAPAGSTIELTDWTVAVGATNRDAGAAVAAANQFNAPPVEGRAFVLAPVTATYTGAESGTAWVSLGIQFVGNAGNTYGMGSDDYCGVIPTPLSDSGELYAGAAANGNVCVSVPAAEIEGGTWVVENQLAFDGVKAFVALQ
jgi:hypothetical protein